MWTQISKDFYGKETVLLACLYELFQDGDTWKFLQESSAMDPRFKNRIDSDAIWHGIQNAAVRVTTTREVQSSLFFSIVTLVLLLCTLIFIIPGISVLTLDLIL